VGGVSCGLLHLHGSLAVEEVNGTLRSGGSFGKCSRIVFQIFDSRFDIRGRLQHPADIMFSSARRRTARAAADPIPAANPDASSCKPGVSAAPRRSQSPWSLPPGMHSRPGKTTRMLRNISLSNDRAVVRKTQCSVLTGVNLPHHTPPMADPSQQRGRGLPEPHSVGHGAPLSIQSLSPDPGRAQGYPAGPVGVSPSILARCRSSYASSAARFTKPYSAHALE
jgi:hypothetical protein